MAKPYPEVSKLNSRAFEAGIPMHLVLKRAGVSRATWWRMKNGADANLSTVHRIGEAIDSLIAEKDQA